MAAAAAGAGTSGGGSSGGSGGGHLRVAVLGGTGNVGSTLAGSESHQRRRDVRFAACTLRTPAPAANMPF